MKLLKHIIRFILLPVSLVFLLLQLIVKFFKGMLSGILSLISAIFLITGIFVIFAEGLMSGVSILVSAFLVSPYGLIMLLDLITDIFAEKIYKLRADLA